MQSVRWMTLLSLILSSPPSVAADPPHIWSKAFGDPSPQYLTDVAVDAPGNVLICGAVYGTINLGGGPLAGGADQDVLVAKLDANGNHLWSKRFGDSAGQGATALAVDNEGNTVMVGGFESNINFGNGDLGPITGSAMFVVKFDPSGAALWSQKYQAAAYGGNNGFASFAGLAVDASGNVLLVGSFRGSISFGGGSLVTPDFEGSDMFLVKLSSSGLHVWSYRFGAVEYSEDHLASVATDPSGNVIVVGDTESGIDFGGGMLVDSWENPYAPQYSDAVIAKFSPSGLHQWSKMFASGGAYPFKLATDPAGNIVLGGSFGTWIELGGGVLWSVGVGANIFVAKLGSLGTHLWSVGIGGTHSSHSGSTNMSDLAVSGTGEVLLAGTYFGRMEVGGGLLTSQGANDMFWAKLSNSGTGIWALSHGNWKEERNSQVAMDNSGNTVIAGALLGTIDFGGGPIASAGNEDIFVSKLGWALTAVSTAAFGDLRVDATPNPFNPSTTLRISLPSGGPVRLEIINVRGERVRTLWNSSMPAGEYDVRWNASEERVALVSGVYFARLAQAGKVTSTKLVLIK